VVFNPASTWFAREQPRHVFGAVDRRASDGQEPATVGSQDDDIGRPDLHQFRICTVRCPSVRTRLDEPAQKRGQAAGAEVIEARP
jgi:hypothetical protein